MSTEPKMTRAESELLAAVRQAARQEQFLEVVSAEEARKRAVSVWEQMKMRRGKGKI